MKNLEIFIEIIKEIELNFKINAAFITQNKFYIIFKNNTEKIRITNKENTILVEKFWSREHQTPMINYSDIEEKNIMTKIKEILSNLLNPSTFTWL